MALKGSFPAADPVFQLVAVGAGQVQIAVVTPADATASPGATAAPSAAQTVTLQADRPLTLLDTATGTRYELRLVASP